MGEEEDEDPHAAEREALRSMWELPSVVHFAQTFRLQFKLRRVSPDVRTPQPVAALLPCTAPEVN